MLDHAEILGVQDIRTVALGNLHILPGAGFLDQVVLPAAGLRTFPVVGVPPRQIVGQQAPAGEGDAHRAVYKGFDAKVLGAVRADAADLLQAALPGQNDSICPEVIEE